MCCFEIGIACLNRGKIKSRSGKSSFTFDTEFHFHNNSTAAARIFSPTDLRCSGQNVLVSGQFYMFQRNSRNVSAGFVNLYNI